MSPLLVRLFSILLATSITLNSDAAALVRAGHPDDIRSAAPAVFVDQALLTPIVFAFNYYLGRSQYRAGKVHGVSGSISATPKSPDPSLSWPDRLAERIESRGVAITASVGALAGILWSLQRSLSHFAAPASGQVTRVLIGMGTALTGAVAALIWEYRMSHRFVGDRESAINKVVRRLGSNDQAFVEESQRFLVRAASLAVDRRETREDFRMVTRALILTLLPVVPKRSFAQDRAAKTLLAINDRWGSRPIAYAGEEPLRAAEWILFNVFSAAVFPWGLNRRALIDDFLALWRRPPEDSAVVRDNRMELGREVVQGVADQAVSHGYGPQLAGRIRPMLKELVRRDPTIYAKDDVRRYLAGIDEFLRDTSPDAIPEPERAMDKLQQQANWMQETIAVFTSSLGLVDVEAARLAMELFQRTPSLLIDPIAALRRLVEEGKMDRSLLLHAATEKFAGRIYEVLRGIAPTDDAGAGEPLREGDPFPGGKLLWKIVKMEPADNLDSIRFYLQLEGGTKERQIVNLSDMIDVLKLKPRDAFATLRYVHAKVIPAAAAKRAPKPVEGRTEIPEAKSTVKQAPLVPKDPLSIFPKRMRDLIETLQENPDTTGMTQPLDSVGSTVVIVDFGKGDKHMGHFFFTPTQKAGQIFIQIAMDNSQPKGRDAAYKYPAEIDSLIAELRNWKPRGAKTKLKVSIARVHSDVDDEAVEPTAILAAWDYVESDKSSKTANARRHYRETISRWGMTEEEVTKAMKAIGATVPQPPAAKAAVPKHGAKRQTWKKLSGWAIAAVGLSAAELSTSRLQAATLGSAMSPDPIVGTIMMIGLNMIAMWGLSQLGMLWKILNAGFRQAIDSAA